MHVLPRGHVAVMPYANAGFLEWLCSGILHHLCGAWPHDLSSLNLIAGANWSPITLSGCLIWIARALISGALTHLHALQLSRYSWSKEIIYWSVMSFFSTAHDPLHQSRKNFALGHLPNIRNRYWSQLGSHSTSNNRPKFMWLPAKQPALPRSSDFLSVMWKADIISCWLECCYHLSDCNHRLLLVLRSLPSAGTRTGKS